MKEKEIHMKAMAGLLDQLELSKKKHDEVAYDFYGYSFKAYKSIDVYDVPVKMVSLYYDKTIQVFTMLVRETQKSMDNKAVLKLLEDAIVWM